ncbi:MAG TPA: GvpL/GvpF family gas vesicle protein [Methylomirabilota bacterium]|nr:GvpL/GvpF family gas vesicle protein [Methylomirabilota bacterium]
MSQYVYALLAEPPRGDTGAGLDAEPLRFIRVDGVLAAVGDMAAAPPVTPTTLRAHDQVVRRLAGLVDAILPVRFGTLLDGEQALADAVAGRAAALRDALALVAGREQITLRVFGDAAPVEDAAPVARELGPGARYLEGRRRQTRRDADVPELAPVRGRLAALVRAERAQRHDVPPLLATVYHLIDRGGAAAYLDAVTAFAAALAPTRAVASGPWPPYAFAPDSLG